MYCCVGIAIVILLSVLLHHNAVIVEKSLIPAFSRLMLQPTAQARKTTQDGGSCGVHLIPMEKE